MPAIKNTITLSSNVNFRQALIIYTTKRNEFVSNKNKSYPQK